MSFNLNLITGGLTVAFDLEGVISTIAAGGKPDLSGLATDIWNLIPASLKAKYSNVTEAQFVSAVNADAQAFANTLATLENKSAS